MSSQATMGELDAQQYRSYVHTWWKNATCQFSRSLSMGYYKLGSSNSGMYSKWLQKALNENEESEENENIEESDG